MRFVRWFLGWIVGSFLVAVVLGSLFWFIASVFGKDMDYFSYIQNWFIAVLLVDFLIDVGRRLNTDRSWDWDMWRNDGNRWS